MLKFKSKEEILKLYSKRYDELDAFVIDNLSKEYEHFMGLIKDCKTKTEVNIIFQKEIELNETRYRKNAKVEGVECNLYNQFMDILAHYGMIVFFRDNIIETEE